jgi:hypothetical protein
MAYVSRNWARRTVAALAALLAATTPLCVRADGPPPKVVALFPTGAQRGATVTVTLSGENLKDIDGFFSPDTGLSGRFLPGGDDKTRTAEIVVAADAPLGIQQVRFYNKAAGLSNPRFFKVGQWPEMMEKEPNDAPQSAVRVSLPVTINGRVAENPDRDGYTFRARAGERIVCEIEGLRVLGQVGDSWLKGYLEITDASGRTLASSGGTSDDYYRWDPLIVFTPPADGEYTAWFRDLNWRGDIRSVYRLTIGAVPHSIGLFPLGGRRGTRVPVTFVGPNCGDAAAREVEVPATADAPFPVSLVTPGGSTNARPFQPGDLPETMQTPGNTSLEKAQAVPFPGVVNGRFSVGTVRDHYRFHVDGKSQVVVLEVFSRRLGTPADPEILLYDAKGKFLQRDDDGRGQDCWISRELGPGDYTVVVRELQDRGGPEYGYRLSIAPPVPALVVTATPDAPLVHRGKTAPLKVKITREYGWDEDVTVTLDALPPGLSAAPVTIPKGKTEADLTLTAAPDAPPGPIRLRLVGSASVGGRAVRATARASETYNIQGTAFQRDVTGPIAFITD